MPTPNQLIEAKLKQLELSTRNFHKYNPDQLEDETSIPAPIWSEYLSREDVRQRITAKINEEIEIAHRQALTALSKEAQRGNIQAIKELNQLSGILNQANTKQIVTHHIPRPTPTPTPQKDTTIKEETNT